MQDAPLAAVHGAEVKRLARFLDALGSRLRAHPQLFNAQNAAIVGIEANPRMFLGSHADRFHGQLLQRQQQLGFVRQQQVDVRAGEAHHQVRVFKIRMRRLAFGHGEMQVEIPPA